MAWLWVPQGLIPEGLEVLKSWGYRYIDEMIWDKYYLGLGRYLRHTHETMLLGIRTEIPGAAVPGSCAPAGSFP